MKAAKQDIPVKVTTVARQLGVATQTVRNWIRLLNVEVYATPLRIPAHGEALKPTTSPQRRSWTIPPEGVKRLLEYARTR